MADNLINSSHFDQARNALDLTGLNAIRQQSKASDSESKKLALQEAAQQFEAIFMQMLLKSMRKAQDVLESDSPFNSESSKFYRDMHDQQMAIELSSNGTLGMSELIVRQLGGGDDNFTPHTVLRNDANLEQIRAAAKRAKLSRGQLTLPKDTVEIPYAVSEKSVKDKPTSVNFSTPSFAQPQDFVRALIEPAKTIQKQIGIPFQVIIAQAALETGWGQKIIKDQNGTSSNNLFNIKADSRWSGDKIQKDTLEFEQGTMIKTSAPFRAYQSLSESFNDYVDFLTGNDRYQEALQNSSNVEHFLHSLQKAGYATDPQYADKIMATLRTVTNLITK